METAGWVKEMLVRMKEDQAMLKSKARPFTAPTHSTPLCFQHTDLHTYDFTQPPPRNTRVSLHVRVSDLDLPPAQRHKLLLLAGDAFDPYLGVITMTRETEDVKATTEKEDREANERNLRDGFKAMLKEARDGKDDFTDVPLDMRHVKVRRSGLEFPEQWLRQKTNETKADVGL
ncbi:37S ribosomal protein S24, mitochondrial [Thoreauomyces humboldtii]|nr:37S ribosomal protein S24, mitochondrial [Thoreauomyces humboldtii]